MIGTSNGTKQPDATTERSDLARVVADLAAHDYARRGVSTSEKTIRVALVARTGPPS